MVTVDDYETKTIKGARFYTYSGKNELGQPTYTTMVQRTGLKMDLLKKI